MSLLIDVARALQNMKAHSMPSAHRLVWLVYAQHASETGRAWPSLALLHDETGYGRTKLAEVVADLVGHEYLVPDGNVGEGLHRSVRYVVRVEGKPWAEDSRAHLARSVDVARASRRANSLPLAARTPSDPPGVQVASRRTVTSVSPRVRNPPMNLPDQPTMRRPSGDRPAGGDPKTPDQALLFSPAEDTPIPGSHLRPTQKVDNGGDVHLETLTPLELRVHEAITGDESLAPIVKLPARLARDLVAICPAVDLPTEVRALGAWLRLPGNRKTKGNAFLLRNLKRKQDEGPRRNGTSAASNGPAPYVPIDCPAHLRSVPKGHIKPREIVEGALAILEAKARGEDVGTPESALEDLMQKLAPARAM